MNPIKSSQIHLKNSKMNYFVHFYQAFSLGFVLIYAGLMSVIHAIFPFLFPANSANKVSWMYIHIIIDSANPDIQAYRRQELALRESRMAEKPHEAQ